MAKGISLHLGIDSLDPRHYSGWTGDLASAEADAREMAELAAGYDRRLLLTKDATREAVTAAILDAADRLEPGDVFLLSFAGRGGFVSDGTTAGRGETWCLWDGQLLADELSVMWATFGAGTRVVVVADTCHGGSPARAHLDRLVACGAISAPESDREGEVPRLRFVPQSVARQTYRRNRAEYDRLLRSMPRPLPHVRTTVRCLGACQANQYALDGEFAGLFTATLLEVWDGGRFDGSYAALHRAVVDRMPPTQSPSHGVVGARNPAFDTQQAFAI